MLELVRTAPVLPRAPGAPCVALVIGEAGYGKSRLLDEVLARGLEGPGIRLRGYEAEREVPFSAATELLRLATPGTGTDTVRVFEGVWRSLRQPPYGFLVVDDVQWVDRSSIALCHYLLRGAAEAGVPLRLLLAGRPSANVAMFADAIERLVEPGRRAVIELGLLSTGASRELLRTVAPRLDGRDTTEIIRRAAGSPFWLHALAGAERGNTQDRAATLRLREAGGDAVRVLATLAVLGRPGDAEELAAIVGWPVARLDPALAELDGRGLVSRGTGIAIAHDLVAETVIAGLPAARVAELHRQIGTALERGAGDDVRELTAALRHLRAGGLSIVPLALRIATSPNRRLIGPEGLAELVGIADAADGAGADAEDLAAGIAQLAAELGEDEVALDRWERIAASTADALGRARAHLGAARAAYRRADGPRVHRHIAAILEEHADPTIAIEARALEAQTRLWLDHDTARGRAAAAAIMAEIRAKLEDAAAANPDPAWVMAARSAVVAEFDASLQGGDLEGLDTAGRLQVTVTRTLGMALRLDGELGRALASYYLGRREESLAGVRRVRAEAERHVLPVLEASAGYWMALMLLDRGDIAEAEEVAERSARLTARMNDQSSTRGRSASLRLRIAMLRGDWRSHFDRLVAGLPDLDPHFRFLMASPAAVLVARIGGTRARADAQRPLVAARDAVAEVQCPRCSRELLLREAEVAARTRDPDTARRALADWHEQTPAPDPVSALEARWIAALIADATTAVRELEALPREAQRLGLGLAATWMQLDRGMALAPAPAGAAVLRDAGAEAERLGAATMVDAAEQALRALGVRTWRRSAQAARLPAIAAERLRELPDDAGGVAP